MKLVWNSIPQVTCANTIIEVVLVYVRVSLGSVFGPSVTSVRPSVSIYTVRPGITSDRIRLWCTDHIFPRDLGRPSSSKHPRGDTQYSYSYKSVIDCCGDRQTKFVLRIQIRLLLSIIMLIFPYNRKNSTSKIKPTFY